MSELEAQRWFHPANVIAHAHGSANILLVKHGIKRPCWQRRYSFAEFEIGSSHTSFYHYISYSARLARLLSNSKLICRVFGWILIWISMIKMAFSTHTAVEASQLKAPYIHARGSFFSHLNLRRGLPNVMLNPKNVPLDLKPISQTVCYPEKKPHCSWGQFFQLGESLVTSW